MGEGAEGAARRELFAALLEGDVQAARTALSRPSDAGWAAVIDETVTPCLREVGRLWELGELSVAEEHRASVALMQGLSAVRPRRGTALSGPSAVVCRVRSEGHVLPAVLAGHLLLHLGWRVWLLGASASPEDVVAFTRRHEPELLVLTATLAGNAPLAQEVTRGLDGWPERPFILLGGAAFTGVAHASDLGADEIGRDFAALERLADGVAARRAGQRHDDLSPARR